ncbi:type iii restriction res subunit family protein, putative [Ichthyophthirius multifiliis]|uniref:Type iii restriction res subunit family protein, putative n=1 Tax=Ichthyophthirius multifiliis TaxID=5932 RepID=G0R5Q8_ICHMU|nr:type iii restriction res subunit family protein, putative [Ichthyophthirius multifiliis]EGR27188.1 type iii restriction res subunit family protein, putative [Ichthyophthirius multifiliis]|eukprot:XP_004024072.1 type iii restriction res subunit family protein, putative [Ichthyophthirius multifiliis]
MICQDHSQLEFKQNIKIIEKNDKKKQSQLQLVIKNNNNKIIQTKINTSSLNNVELINENNNDIKKDKNKIIYTYEDFLIPPVINFDYSNYPSDWCRYCGARFASNFTKGPWGPRTLCTIHYIAWSQNKTLNLSQYPVLPTQPVNPEDQTEIQFMNRTKLKDEYFNPQLQLQQKMNTALQKKYVLKKITKEGGEEENSLRDQNKLVNICNDENANIN